MKTLLFFTLLSLLSLSVLSDTVFQAERDPDQLVWPLDQTKVPGKNPVEICSLSPSEDLVEITYIDVTPNPPQAGQNLTIEAEGILKTTIKEGAYANFEVKYGFVKLLSGTADLCEKAKEVGLECPIEEGTIKIKKVVELPSQIPPGKYQVTANIFTVDEELITCLTATVFFRIVRPFKA